jgi:hypothetical protein
MNIASITKSKNTTAVGAIALIIACLGIVQTVLGSGFESVDWGSQVPLIISGLLGLFAKDADKSGT